MEDKENFYIKLKATLEETSTFPCPYLYKFIVPANGGQLDEVKNVFKNLDVKLSTKASRTGKYDSVSIEMQVDSADQVISIYKQMESIEGIISL